MVRLHWLEKMILNLKSRIRGCWCSPYSKSEDSIFDCPDDILIEILSRVPADRLEVFKRVSRHWRVLISSYRLFKLHIKRAREDEESISSPLFFVQHSRKKDTELIWLHCGRSVEYWPYPGIIWSSCHNYMPIDNLIDSCDGLLMFRIRGTLCSRTFILNPITQQTRLITNPHDINREYCCCIFFDQFEDDYKILHIYPERVNPGFDDYIYSFNRNVWERIEHVKTRHLFIPRDDVPPVRVADALHWIGEYKVPCSKRVLVFKIETKEFFFLPHPAVIKTDIKIGDNCCWTEQDLYRVFWHDDDSIQLIERNGQLCLCHTMFTSKVIDIWILEDYGNWQLWVRKFKVDLPFVRATNFRRRMLMDRMRIVSVKDDGILLAWELGGLYFLSLEKNKLKIIIAHGSYQVIPFTKTLLSPNNVYTTL